MKLKNILQVRPVLRSEVRHFIETHHYSKSINGVTSDICFGLFWENRLVGAMLFGKLGMAGCWKKYADSADKVIELRRLCCIDDTPPFSESFFIGAALRWLKANTQYAVVVSYADPNHGHQGTIYKASNFTYLGITSPTKVIVRISDQKVFHDKTIRTYYKGKLKPYAQRLVEDLAQGRAEYSTQLGKHIYTYYLRKP